MSLPAAEISALREASEATMGDACKIGTQTQSGWGVNPSESWTYGAPVDCGVDTSRSRQAMDGSEATLTDALIRLPQGTTIGTGSRIKVTYRHGAALAEPEVYAVLGAPRNGLSCIVCACRRLTGESAHA